MSAQQISFPKVTVNKLPALTTVENEEQKVLFIGQMISGTATAGTLTTSVGVSGEEDALFGAASMIAGMIRGARNVNKNTRFDAIGLADDGGAVDAAGAVVFSGPASAAGTITVTIGSREDHKYELTIADTDSATVIGDALVTAITADTNAPFAGVNTTGSVAITALNGGPEANSMSIQVLGTVAGVSYTITAMASGATAPTLTGIPGTLVGDTRYQTVIFPQSYGFDFITDDFLDDRFNVNDDILDGIAITSKTDSKANLETALNLENSQSLVVLGNKPVSVSNEYEGSAMLELDYVIASRAGAVRSLRLTQGANLSNIVTVGDNFLDYEGGAGIASLPYANTQINGLPLVDEGRGWTKSETVDLNDAGGSVIGNNRANNAVIFGEMLTTYKTDTGGNPDLTWKFLNSVDTMSNGAEFVFNNLKRDFAQSRLTDGDLVQGRGFVNESRFRATMMGYYDELSGPEFAILRAGETNRKFFSDNMSVILSLVDGKITSGQKWPIVVQLREILVQAQTVFDIS